MRSGIGSYTFGWATGTYGQDVRRDQPLMAAEELIAAAEELGVEVVQFCVLPNLVMEDNSMLEKLHRLAQARGITLELGTTGTEVRELLTWLRCRSRERWESMAKRY